jgi:ankyrin repeat protein
MHGSSNTHHKTVTPPLRWEPDTRHFVALLLQHGRTPLHMAALWGQKEVVAELLGAGAAMDATAKVGPHLSQSVDGGGGIMRHSYLCDGTGGIA